VKIGLLVPLTGPFTPTGKQLTAGAKLYMLRHGDTVARKKIELIVKDDTGNAETTKRLAQELVVNNKEAAKYAPLDQLCLSPQCGFASTEEGNVLAEDEEWAKLRLVVKAADEVWG